MRLGLLKTVLLSGVLSGLMPGGPVQAQSSSLYGDPHARRPLLLDRDSWLFVKVEPPRQIQLNDQVTVIVDHKSQVISEGEIDRRKRANIDARLQDWLELDGFGVKPAPQADGDPRIRALINSQYRASGDLQTRDGMQFRIAARVVDIRPNGHLVLEAHQSIRNNSEVWEASLMGIVRPEDVLPNNTVLSEDIAELSICKREKGSIRDSYRRGWLFKLWDSIHAF